MNFWKPRQKIKEISEPKTLHGNLLHLVTSYAFKIGDSVGWGMKRTVLPGISLICELPDDVPSTNGFIVYIHGNYTGEYTGWS